VSIHQIHRVVLVAVLGWLQYACTGQIDTTLLLPAVHVTTPKPAPSIIGERTEFWNDSLLSTQQSRSLGELIANETGAFVKTYGSGGIATISLRGSSAGQTTITWNGVPLQNPMLGLQDLSLIPLGFIDDAQISYGGNTAAEGSGSIAGVIALRNDNATPVQFGAKLNTTLGSFGFWDQDIQLKYGNGKIGGRTRYFHQQSINDFTYEIRPDLPVQKQSHGQIKQNGILQELYYSIKSNQQLSAFVWWQQNDRQIPPTTVQNKSEASQEDESLRLMVNWKMRSNIWKWNAKVAAFKDKIRYSDPQILLEANSNSTVVMGELEGQWSIDPAYLISFGLNHYAYSAQTDSYDGRQTQNRTALYASYMQIFGKWSGQLNIRQELVDGKFAPFTAALGIEGELTSWLKIKTKISRDYRLPTLNDMYWVPGGSPDLIPEKGWSQELGIAIERDRNKHRLKYSATGFNRNISNWILWSIEAGETFWSVKNIAEVHSFGLEQRLKYSWQSGPWGYNISLGYDYIRSINEIALDNPMIEAGEQLIYVPVHSARGSIGAQWNGLSVNYHQTFTGKVHTEFEDELDSYSLGNLSIQYNLPLNKFAILPFFEVDNLWDINYRILQYRPMPGRNFRLGLKMNFNSGAP
jgi:outer membrane cobalamin receptor